ncbi:MAG: UDP-N-acetylglucosamine 2-epimerase (non-hydrolyzing) [Gammaproteobacteria bacterium]
MKIVSIVGARPQFVKLAPFARVIDAHNIAKAEDATIEHIIVHSGQHYDAGMSDVFFDELQIPKPDYNLQIGSGSHGWQTGRMLEKLDVLLARLEPDRVMVYGDTNSTLAGALAAVKRHYKLIHVEAGLRSFNRHMPEEINRIVTDHVCDVLLAPTQTAIDNLKAENLAKRTVFTGDVMYDAVLFNSRLAEQRSNVLARMALTPGSYGVVTIHRAENTGSSQLRSILDTLSTISAQYFPLVFPVHPRTRACLNDQLRDWQVNAQLQLAEPQGYLDMLQLVANARIVLTDSGGLQKEAFFLNCPCITLREETEWVETVIGGGNVVCGTQSDAVIKAVQRWQQHLSAADQSHSTLDFSAAAHASFGDGRSAEIILAAVLAS